MTKEQIMMARLEKLCATVETTDAASTLYTEAIDYAKKAIQMQEKLKKEIEHLRGFSKDVAQSRALNEDIAQMESFLVDAIPLTLADADIRCEGEIFVEDDFINFSWECWFDVDKMFGTDTRNDDDMWVNFYTNWYPSGDVKAVYVVASNTMDREYEYSLSVEEKEALLKKMEAYCKEKEGLSVSELWEEFQKEEEGEKGEV